MLDVVEFIGKKYAPDRLRLEISHIAGGVVWWKLTIVDSSWAVIDASPGACLAALAGMVAKELV